MWEFEKIKIKGADIEYMKINHSINGNPRYIVHFTEIAKSWEEALYKIKKIGGKIYKHKKWKRYLVFSSYNLLSDFKEII